MNARVPWFAGLRESWRRKREASLRDKLDDAEAHHRRFGFANYPSEDRAELRRIAQLRAKIERLHKHVLFGDVDRDGDQWCNVCKEWVAVPEAADSHAQDGDAS